MVLSVVALLGGGGCAAQRAGGLAGTAVASGGTTEVVVYAAASLGDVFRGLAAAYEEEHPGTAIVLSFDASNLLRVRIEEGAPADVLAAADTENPERLARAGLAAGEPVAFARNELAIVVPAANRAGIARVTDISRPGVRLVAAADDVPITGYAAELLDRLARTTGAPSDFAARVMRNVVSREDNVRAVLAKVELGEADAGIVYRTDASSTRVRAIPVPAGANVAVTYAAVAVARTRSSPGANPGTPFVAWLSGETAADILARAGFQRP